MISNNNVYQKSILARWISGIIGNQKAFIGSCIILFFGVSAIFIPPFIQSPTDFLSTPLLPPSFEYFFGTNGQGQDVFAQTICGARQTLFVGFSAGTLVVIIGALIGGIAGYYGGRIDDILSLLINVFLKVVENPENIKGPCSSLSEDGHQDRKFDYMITNPPFGVSWKSDQKQILNESKRHYYL